MSFKHSQLLFWWRSIRVSISLALCFKTLFTYFESIYFELNKSLKSFDYYLNDEQDDSVKLEELVEWKKQHKIAREIFVLWFLLLWSDYKIISSNKFHSILQLSSINSWFAKQHYEPFNLFCYILRETLFYINSSFLSTKKS